MYIHIDLYAYTYLHTHMYIYIYVYTYMHVYIYIYMLRKIGIFPSLASWYEDRRMSGMGWLRLVGSLK